VPEAPLAIIAHASPGRVRFRIPERKGDQEYFQALRAVFERCPSVQSVEARAATGSILLLHSGTLEHMVRDEGIGRLLTFAPSQEPEVLRCPPPRGRAPDRQRNQVNWSGMAALSLVGVSIVQVLRGNLTAPAWHTALWYAYNLGRSALGRDAGREGPEEQVLQG
jgi:hypothetical protein